jgi:septum formation protein
MALRGEKPAHLVRRLAFQKALEVSMRFPHALVIGADTVVVAQGSILGKPANGPEAFRTIQLLSGRSHAVTTGVALVGPGGMKKECHVDRSRVAFRALTRQEIKAYVQTPEPYDKAGAYDIRGQASRWVGRLEGEYFNVMGLPVQWLLTRLDRLGLIRSGRF